MKRIPRDCEASIHDGVALNKRAQDVLCGGVQVAVDVDEGCLLVGHRGQKRWQSLVEEPDVVGDVLETEAWHLTSEREGALAGVLLFESLGRPVTPL